MALALNLSRSFVGKGLHNRDSSACCAPVIGLEEPSGFLLSSLSLISRQAVAPEKSSAMAIPKPQVCLLDLLCSYLPLWFLLLRPQGDHLSSDLVASKG